MKKLIASTLGLAVGIGVLAQSYRPPWSTTIATRGAEVDPVLFALGIAICIVAGTVVVKAIREYLK